MNQSTIPQTVRDQFEDYAYRAYTASRMAVLMEKGREALQDRDKHEPIDQGAYCKFDHVTQTYKEPALDVMFVGYKLALDALAPALEAATMWRQFAEAQDRIFEQIPEDYTIALEMEKEGFFITLANTKSEYVVYEDPPDLEKPGSMFRILDAALAAAKADHAKGLN